MSKFHDAAGVIRHLDEMAAGNQWVNRMHPLVKLLLTVAYILIAVSFPKYDVAGLLPLALYLVIAFELASLSFRSCLWRLRAVLPIICLVGAANPFLDTAVFRLGTLSVRAGLISMLTLMMKGIFAVLAFYWLVATTTIEALCYALRLIHVPSVMVTQILLTYRYITLLLEEAERITQAYALRAPRQTGIHIRVWGSLTGQLLLRSIDRANAVYEAMTLRGYCGEFRYMGEHTPLRLTDIAYGAGWIFLLCAMRMIPVVQVLGDVFGGLWA